jgi:hypothetical protein
MYLSAFLHRDEFFEIANRWLSDRLQTEDPLQITRIIAYDSFVAWETLLPFIDDLLSALTRGTCHKTAISHKKELKDFICHNNEPKTKRIERLIEAYKKTPEFFYVGSPIVGYIYHDCHLHMMALSRMKRVKRIAEKASRYAKMHILGEIRAEARDKSEDGRSLMEAEKRLMARIRDQGLRLPVEPMIIKDVLGMKVVDNGFGEEGLESAVSKLSGVKILEKKHQSGKYNAVHYIIELPVHLPSMIHKFEHMKSTYNFTERGLSADALCGDFSAFIKTGAEAIQVDLIFTSYDELIESEIGRSMHEERIFAQRQQGEFHGHILTNIEYIIEYLFAVGLSPTSRIDEIPIKLWGRYLPDTLSHKVRQLYRLPEYALISM